MEVEKVRETNSESAQSQFSGRASLAHLVAFSSAQLGVVSASQSEDQSGVGDRRTDFRINTCTLHKSGALLLDDRDRLSIDDALNWTSNHFRNRISSFAPSASIAAPVDLPFPISGSTSGTSGEVAPVGTQDMEERRDSEAPSALEPTFDNHFGGNDLESDEEIVNHDSSLPVEELATTTISNAPSEQREKSQRKREKPRPRTPSEEDEWVMLDPHEEGLSKQLKPFKKGKPFKLPKKDENGRLYFSKKSPKPSDSVTSSNSLFTLAFQGTNYPTNSLLKSAFFPEFEYLNQRVIKLRGNEKKKWQEDILAKV